MKNLCVICDREADYARRFMEYETHKKTFPMEIAACTSLKSAKELSAKRKIDLLLVAEGTADPGLSDLEAGKVIVLSEGKNTAGLENLTKIGKYQSCNTILRTAMSCFEAENAALFGVEEASKKKELIAVYSPVGGSGKTLFSITLGQILSQTAPTLYMNLECFSGVDRLLGLDDSSGLSDLLYFSKERSKLITVLSSCAQTRVGLDCVPGVSTPEDICGTDPYEWLGLFSSLINDSRYENMIIEPGSEVRGLFCILDQCKRVYMPVRDDAFSRARTADFLEHLAGSPYANAASKIIQVTVPAFDAKNTVFPDELIWSSLGDHVRAVIAKGGMQGGSGLS